MERDFTSLASKLLWLLHPSVVPIFDSQAWCATNVIARVANKVDTPDPQDRSDSILNRYCAFLKLHARCFKDLYGEKGVHGIGAAIDRSDTDFLGGGDELDEDARAGTSIDDGAQDAAMHGGGSGERGNRHDGAAFRTGCAANGSAGAATSAGAQTGNKRLNRAGFLRKGARREGRCRRAARWCGSPLLWRRQRGNGPHKQARDQRDKTKITIKIIKIITTETEIKIEIKITIKKDNSNKTQLTIIIGTKITIKIDIIIETKTTIEIGIMKKNNIIHIRGSVIIISL